MSDFKKERMAITMGDAGENHIGVEMLGKFGEKGSGFTTEDLKNLKKYFKEKDVKVKYLSFTLEKDGSKYEAGVLILRNYLNENKQKKIYNELKDLSWDKQFYDTRRKKVLNKHARYNLMLLDGVKQKADYKNKKGTIIDINDLEEFNKFKKNITKKINTVCDGKATGLIAEGNRYFDLKQCGLGWHGDKERRKVICLSLGADNYEMMWVWFHKNKPISEPFKVLLNSGDVYIMSEEAIGTEWNKSSIPTMRHAAGCKKYTNLDKYDEELQKKKQLDKEKRKLEKEKKLKNKSTSKK